ncbi:MAG: folate-binding protein [Pseudomonadota bacterium]
MSKPRFSRLPGRSVIRVSGPEAEHFLEGLLSAAVEKMEESALIYAALLTPQGKIVSDVMVHGAGDGTFALDVPEAAKPDLTRRLTMYKLRAKVDITPTDEAVLVGAGGGAADPRHQTLGSRTIGTGEEDGEVLDAYTKARIDAGVPDAGVDFALGDTFPHDANMDLTGGVDFSKGCFVGQEVVSRMKHRGTARRRTVIVRSDGPLPESGTPLTARGKPVGTLGTVLGGDGLAIVRVDRVDGTAEAGDVPVRLFVPEGAPFSFAAPVES